MDLITVNATTTTSTSPTSRQTGGVENVSGSVCGEMADKDNDQKEDNKRTMAESK